MDEGGGTVFCLLTSCLHGWRKKLSVFCFFDELFARVERTRLMSSLHGGGGMCPFLSLARSPLGGWWDCHSGDVGGGWKIAKIGVVGSCFASYLARACHAVGLRRRRW